VKRQHGFLLKLKIGLKYYNLDHSEK